MQIETDTVDLFIRRHVPTTDGVYVRGTVEGVDATLTVDTGASVTLVSKQIYDEIPLPQRPQLTSKLPLLKNADGNIIPSYGVADFPPSFGPCM